MSSTNDNAGNVALRARIHLEPFPALVVLRRPRLNGIETASAVTRVHRMTTVNRGCRTLVIRHIQNIGRQKQRAPHGHVTVPITRIDANVASAHRRCKRYRHGVVPSVRPGIHVPAFDVAELTVISCVFHLERPNVLVFSVSSTNDNAGDVSLRARVHFEPLSVLVVLRRPRRDRV